MRAVCVDIGIEVVLGLAGPCFLVASRRATFDLGHRAAVRCDHEVVAAAVPALVCDAPRRSGSSCVAWGAFVMDDDETSRGGRPLGGGKRSYRVIHETGRPSHAGSPTANGSPLAAWSGVEAPVVSATAPDHPAARA